MVSLRGYSDLKRVDLLPACQTTTPCCLLPLARLTLAPSFVPKFTFRRSTHTNACGICEESSAYLWDAFPLTTGLKCKCVEVYQSSLRHTWLRRTSRGSRQNTWLSRAQMLWSTTVYMIFLCFILHIYLYLVYFFCLCGILLPSACLATGRFCSFCL